MDIESKFQSKILSYTEDDEAYQLYRAALEWDLVDPIVIESPKDFKSAHRWTEHVTPFRTPSTSIESNHSGNDLYFLRCRDIAKDLLLPR